MIETESEPRPARQPCAVKRWICHGRFGFHHQNN
jgi:hypothetical protein